MKQYSDTIEDARQIVLGLEKKCKIADHAYTVNTEEADKLLEIIEVFGKKISKKEKMDLENPHPAMKAKNILINVVDKSVAEKVRRFLKRGPKLDFAIENALRSGIIRMAGF